MVSRKNKKLRNARKTRQNNLMIVVVVLAVLILLSGIWWAFDGWAEEIKEAPEAQKVLDFQSEMPFQILIPAYLPKQFLRAEMEIDINQNGPGNEPMVVLSYRTAKLQTLFIKEWVPVNPALEILAASRPIETKWGQGWLLKQGETLAAIWSDIGPLRVSVYTNNLDILPIEQLLAVTETLGPASNQQVFSFIVDPPTILEMKPPPPDEIPINSDGIQEVDLIVTPGGYDPLRFAVKLNVPVKLSFRQLGEVGCGNELNFPIGKDNLTTLKLASEDDRQVLEFIPKELGEFQFFCGHLMYRGVMYVVQE